MKLCKDCRHFLPTHKILDPSIYETYPHFDKCAMLYIIEPVRGLRVCDPCKEAREAMHGCGKEGRYHEAV